jgi:amidase
MSPVDNSVKNLIESAAALLAEAGADVDTEVRPAIASADLHRIYMQLLNAAMSPGTPSHLWNDLVAKAEVSPDGDDSTDDTVLFALDTTMPHRRWLSANERRARAQQAWADVFDDVDVVLAPIQPVAAFPHDIDRPYGKRTLEVNGSDVPYRGILFWAGLATMPHLPAVAIPVGHTIDGLPVGMQLIGPKWSDHKIVSIGEEITSVLDQHFTPPPLVAG